MRRRFFWTIALTSVVTGLVVLLAVLITTRRVSQDATERELARSSAEIAAIIEDSLQGGRGPGATLEVLRLLEGDLGPLFSRVRRATGGSLLAFGAVSAEGEVVSNNELFTRVEVDPGDLTPGETVFYSSADDGLVAVTPVTVERRGATLTLIIGLAREAPILTLGDFGLGWLLIAAGAVLLASVVARVLSSQLAARLAPLTDATHRLAAGEVDVVVPPVGDPDLDGVGSAFNDMATEIKSTRDREREFLLGVGHDLRTPLTTIAGFSEALETEELDPVEVSRIGSVLGVQSRQMGRLIEDLTLLARLDQPEFSVRVEPVDIGSHVGEVVEGFRRSADTAGVKMDADLATEVIVETDADRLAQITRNLIENALRFTPEAGRVTVTVKREGGDAVLRVSDTGVGIDPEDLPHVFERHYVGRTRRVRDQGTGLGLSIVQALAGRLGTELEIDSTPGSGTTVTLEMPAIPV